MFLIQGILKGKSAKPKKPNKVAFPSTEFQVIGYGGDDVYSDDEDLPDLCDRVNTDEPDTEQDRVLYKLTKSNTEFNSVPANLEGVAKIEPIRLGTLLTDDKGQKKTLLVSVTPFCGGNAVNTAKAKICTEKPADKEVVVVSENEELPIVPVPKSADVAIKRSQPIDKNSKFRPQREANEETKNMDAPKPEERISLENKINEKMTTSTKVANLLDKAKKKVNQLPVIGDPNHYKLKALDFSPVALKKNVDTAKPVVLDMYDLREAEDSEKNEKPITPVIVFETKKSDDELPVSVDEPVTDETPKNDCSSVENGLEGKLENFEKIIGGEEVTVFSLENSVNLEPRLAPDGQADSVPVVQDVPVEELPPALPLSPPPAADPRVSFLHQLTGSAKTHGEKPKVPAKPIVIPAKKSQFRVFSVS